MDKLFNGKYRTLVIALTSIIFVIGIFVIWMGVVFGFAYTLDFAFTGGGTFSVAFNKIIFSCVVLLPSFFAYFLLHEIMKGQRAYFLGLSRPRKALMFAKNFAVMIVVCAGISYGNFASCDDFSCDDSEPLTTLDKRAVFFRLVMVSALGMAVAYKKTIARGA
jgi:hypothetical protein